MKTSEIRELNDNELNERIESEVARLNDLKFNHHISPLEDPSVIKKTRRDIARLKGELRLRQLNA